MTAYLLSVPAVTKGEATTNNAESRASNTLNNTGASGSASGSAGASVQ